MSPQPVKIMTITMDSFHRILRSVIAEFINYETSSYAISEAVKLATEDCLRDEITYLVKSNLRVNEEQTLESKRWITESNNFDDPHREISQQELDGDREEIKIKAARLASYAYSFLEEHNELPIFQTAEEKTKSAITNLLCKKFNLKASADDEDFEQFNCVLLSLLQGGDFKISPKTDARRKSTEEVFEDDSDIPF